MDSTFFFYVWLIIGLVFLISEVGAPGLFFFISGGIGAFAAALIAYFDYSFYIQALVWTLVSVASFCVLRFVVVKLKKNPHKTNIQALIGQRARVTQRIDLHGVGYVKVRGEEWAAISHYEFGIDIDAIVTVVGHSGNKLIVKP